VRKISREQLELAKKMLAVKRYSCGDGLLQDALEVAECLILTQLTMVGPEKTDYIYVEDLE